MSDQVFPDQRIISAESAEIRRFAGFDKHAVQAVAERVLSVLSPLLLLGLWEALVLIGLLDARFFPAPSDVMGAFWKMAVSVQATDYGTVVTPGLLAAHVGTSMVRALLGFALGAIPGIAVGLTLGLFPIVRAALWPMMGALYPIPKIAILPLVMLIFGLGESSKWVIIAIGVFFPLVINSMVGVMSIDKIYHDVGRNFGASRLDRYLTIALPGALPLILAGVRLGWGTALLLMVTAEFVASKVGLGYLIWQGWQSFAIEQMYVGIILVSFIGYLSFLLLDQAARLIVPWKPEAVE